MGQAQGERDAWNGCRFARGTQAGHYESWFQRGNHPDHALAFWIRYTIFSPAGHPENAVGELWAIFFDGERGRTIAVKQEIPIGECSFASSGLDVRVAAAVLTGDFLHGRVASGGHDLAWSLAYSGVEAPLLLLPRALYRRPLPRAKALVGTPNADFRGSIVVDGEKIPVVGWRGSQNHNWGSRHTDSYAWGQVAGFDDAPGVFLECSTAQLRVGPLWTPRMSMVVVRTGGDEVALTSLGQALRAKGRYEGFDWNLESAGAAGRVRVHIHAAAESFVALTYPNPPGGTKTCLNTKLATCELTLQRPGRPAEMWTTRNRAAFEILTDRIDHGIPVVL